MACHRTERVSHIGSRGGVWHHYDKEASTSIACKESVLLLRAAKSAFIACARMPITKSVELCHWAWAAFSTRMVSLLCFNNKSRRHRGQNLLCDLQGAQYLAVPMAVMARSCSDTDSDTIVETVKIQREKNLAAATAAVQEAILHFVETNFQGFAA